MMNRATLQELQTGVEAIVRVVGRYLKDQLGAVRTADVQEKSLKSLVSYVDRTAEQMLVEGLRKCLPTAGFVTEEGTVEQGRQAVRWIIDPLDGTTNFLHGIPAFCISVALEDAGSILIGCIYEPLRDELFSAASGCGATLNGKVLSVSANQEPGKALGATGFPYVMGDAEGAMMLMYADMLRQTRGLRRIGSAAIDLAWVAAGRFDFFYEPWLNPWDVAAGHLLVEEAGGIVTDFSGGNHAIFGGQILAASPALHPWVMNRLKASGMAGLPFREVV